MCLNTEPCGVPLILCHSNRNQIRIRDNNNNTITVMDPLLFTLDQK